MVFAAGVATFAIGQTTVGSCRQDMDSAPNEVAVYRALSMQAVEVETFFNAKRLTTNINDTNLVKKKNSSSGAEPTYCMIESKRNSSTKTM